MLEIDYKFFDDLKNLYEEYLGVENQLIANWLSEKICELPTEERKDIIASFLLAPIHYEDHITIPLLVLGNPIPPYSPKVQEGIIWKRLLEIHTMPQLIDTETQKINNVLQEGYKGSGRPPKNFKVDRDFIAFHLDNDTPKYVEYVFNRILLKDNPTAPKNIISVTIPNSDICEHIKRFIDAFKAQLPDYYSENAMNNTFTLTLYDGNIHDIHDQRVGLPSLVDYSVSSKIKAFYSLGDEEINSRIQTGAILFSGKAIQSRAHLDEILRQAGISHNSVCVNDWLSHNYASLLPPYELEFWSDNRFRSNQALVLAVKDKKLSPVDAVRRLAFNYETYYPTFLEEIELPIELPVLDDDTSSLEEYNNLEQEKHNRFWKRMRRTYFVIAFTLLGILALSIYDFVQSFIHPAVYDSLMVFSGTVAGICIILAPFMILLFPLFGLSSDKNNHS